MRLLGGLLVPPSAKVSGGNSREGVPVPGDGGALAESPQKPRGGIITGAVCNFSQAVGSRRLQHAASPSVKPIFLWNAPFIELTLSNRRSSFQASPGPRTGTINHPAPLPLI